MRLKKPCVYFCYHEFFNLNNIHYYFVNITRIPGTMNVLSSNQFLGVSIICVVPAQTKKWRLRGVSTQCEVKKQDTGQ
jgi:hypothetical protein